MSSVVTVCLVLFSAWFSVLVVRPCTPFCGLLGRVVQLCSMRCVRWLRPLLYMPCAVCVHCAVCDPENRCMQSSDHELAETSKHRSTPKRAKPKLFIQKDDASTQGYWWPGASRLHTTRAARARSIHLSATAAAPRIVRCACQIKTPARRDKDASHVYVRVE